MAVDAPMGKIRLHLRNTPRDDGVSRNVSRVPWPILVVDDDPQVHDMSRTLFRDFEFQGRPFTVLSAFSAAEALPLLAAHPDIPVILLDVVMENDQAGLDLVRVIRQDMGNHRIRIILRTGHPGQAPERQVMLDYDINDYRSKTELTASQLFTAVSGALRSWSHIETIEHLNQSLEKRVAQRTQELAQARAFAEHLIDQIPAPVWVRDANGALTHANAAFRRFFDQSIDGPPILPDALTLPQQFDLETEACLTIGPDQSRTAVITQRPIPGLNGQAGGCIGLLNDITERKQLEADLRRLAITDPLTECYNRRYFMQQAELEIDRARRHGRPLSILMMDLDLFKQINDRYGHSVGDDVLKTVVRTCMTHLRGQDNMARLGGEEFAILAPETSLSDGVILAERLRCAIAATPIPLVDGSLRVTVSIGVGQSRGDDISLDRILLRADQALYAAKARGRNCVFSSPAQGG